MAEFVQMPSKAGTRSRRPAFMLAIAIAALAVPGSARTWNLPDHASKTQGWTVTDLDGDKLADLAASAPGQLDGNSYTHRVDILLTGLQSTSFVVHAASPAIRLTFRDIDGDHDRDLVVVDSWSSKPVGVWLNDGSGHFAEANPEKYAGALQSPGSELIQGISRLAGSPVGLHEERTPAPNLSHLSSVFAVSRTLVLNTPAWISRTVILDSVPRGPPLHLQRQD